MALLFAVDTGPGRSSLVRLLGQVRPQSGLTISADAIEGSIYDRFQVRNLELSDLDGVFFRIPRAEISWHPSRLLTAQEIRIDSLDAARAILLRAPRLRPGSDRDPLGGYRLVLRQFDIRSLVLAEGVAGRQRDLRLAGHAVSQDRRTDLGFVLRDSAGDDRLAVSALADAARDLFDIEARLDAPADGLFAHLLTLSRPLRATITGEGTWRNWSGRLVAGDPETRDRFARIGLSARQSEISLRGRIDPGRLLGGIAARLAPEGLAVRGRVSFPADIAAMHLRTRNENLSLDMQARIDPAARRIEDGSALLSLRRPSALIRTLSGKDMRLRVGLEGPLLSPTGRYRFTATRFALGNQTLISPNATGRFGAGTASDLTMDGSFDRLEGAGDLLRNLSRRARVRADIDLDGLRADAGRLRLQTAAGTAVGPVSLDLRTGRYDARVAVDVPHYEIPQFAVAAIAGKLHLYPDPAGSGRMRFEGPVTARLLRLDNALLSYLFGGLPQGSADVVRTPAGRLLLSSLVMRGPDMRLAGSGTYDLGGQIELTGSGRQRTFGTGRAVLSGDISRPAADVRLDRYTLGIPISDIDARFRPDAEGYAFAAAGDTALGELAAGGRIDSGPSGTLYRIDSVALAGVVAGGTLRPAGGMPVQGQLALSGDGVSGNATFSAEGDDQRIRVGVAFDGARLDTPIPTRLGSGGAEVDILVTPDGTRSRANFGLAGARFGTLLANDVNGRFDYEDGAAKAAVALTGRRGKPYRLALDLDYADDRYVLGGEGRYGDVVFRLATPARISGTPDGYRLAPTTLQVGEGSVRVSGTTGARTTFDATLEDVDLAPVSLALPRLDFSGRASGQVQYAAAPGAPASGSLRLALADFARATGARARSGDIALVGKLLGTRAALKARLRTRDRGLGNLDMRLSRLDPGNPIASDSLASAGLDGRFDYRGESALLWSLTGVEAVAISGPVSGEVDFAGRLFDPVLTGAMTGSDLRFESAASGTVVENAGFSGRFVGSNLIISDISGQSQGGGTVTGDARIDLSLDRGFPVRANIVADNTSLVDIDTLTANVSGSLALASDQEGGRISGDLTVERARYRPGNAQLSAIPALKVREINREFARASPSSASSSTWTLDVGARGNDQITVRGNGLDSEWAVDFDIVGNATEPKLLGSATLVRGDYDFAGRRFELTRGEIGFQGRYPPDPSLDIDAAARVEGLTATIRIRGIASRPEISFASVPALPQDEILSRVLFGTSIAKLSAAEAIQLAGAVAALQSGGSSPLDPVGAVRDALGVDRLRLSGGEGSGGGAGVAAGEYLGSRTYVEVATDTEGNAATRIEHALTRSLSILGQVSSFKGNSIGVRVSHDY